MKVSERMKRFTYIPEDKKSKNKNVKKAEPPKPKLNSLENTFDLESIKCGCR